MGLRASHWQLCWPESLGPALVHGFCNSEEGGFLCISQVSACPRHETFVYPLSLVSAPLCSWRQWFHGRDCYTRHSNYTHLLLCSPIPLLPLSKQDLLLLSRLCCCCFVFLSIPKIRETMVFVFWLWPISFNTVIPSSRHIISVWQNLEADVTLDALVLLSRHFPVYCFVECELIVL